MAGFVFLNKELFNFQRYSHFLRIRYTIRYVFSFPFSLGFFDHFSTQKTYYIG